MPIFCVGFPCKLATASVLVPFSTVINAAAGADSEIVVGIQDLQNSDPRVVDILAQQPKTRVYHSAGCTNLSSNLNFLISKANSRYFVRTDDDDLMHPTRLIHLDRIIRNGSDFAILGQSYKSFTSRHTSPVIHPSHHSLENKLKLLLGVPYAHPAITMDLSKVGSKPYDINQTYAQDYMLYVDTINKGAFLGDSHLATYYRSPIQHSAAQQAKRRKQLEDHENAMYKIWNKISPGRFSKREIHYLRALLVSREFTNVDADYNIEWCRDRLDEGTSLLRTFIDNQ